MEKAVFRRLGTTVYQDKTQAGLNCVFVPVENTHKKIFAIIVSKGGSPDVASIDGTKIPAGAAHFLEHRLFQTEKGDAMFMFSRMGCDSNAFTTSSSTCFFFSTYGDYVEPLNLLVEMCTSFYMSEDDVKRESEIIQRERQTTLDYPVRTALEAVEDALYFESPIKEEIIGTPNSIRSTHVSALKKFFQAFYGLDNMSLLCIGDIDPDECFAQAQKLKLYNHFAAPKEIKLKEFKEDRTKVKKPFSEVVSPDGQTYLALGVKFPDRHSLYDKYGDLLFALYELLPDFVSSSIIEPLEKLKDSGLIISVSDAFIEQSGEDAFLSALYTTNAPQKLKEKLEDYLSDIPRHLSLLGSEIKALKLSSFADSIVTAGDPDSLLEEMVDSYENHLAWPAVAGRAATLTTKDVLNFLKDFSSWPRAYVALKKPEAK